MGKTSPWRASAGSLVLSALAGGVFAWVLWVNSGELVAGIVVATVTVLAFYPAELQAASRLSWRLREFAGQVPGEPEAEVSAWGDQSLHWPDLGLSVEGSTHRFQVRGLTAEAKDRTWYVQLSRPREGARRVLDDLGRDPALEDFEDRLPSVYPRLSGLKAGALVAFVAFVAVGLGGPIVAGGSYPLWWVGLPLVAGGLVGGIRLAGLRRTRRAIAELAQGLGQGGVRLERVDLVAGLFRLTFAVRTSHGTAMLRCDALPRGRLAVSHGDRETRTRISGITATGRELARWLADTSISGSVGVTEPPARGELTAAQRLLFAVLGAVFSLFGAGFVLFGSPWGGPVSLEVLVVGFAAGVVGVVLLAVCLLGRVPTVWHLAPSK